MRRTNTCWVQPRTQEQLVRVMDASSNHLNQLHSQPADGTARVPQVGRPPAVGVTTRSPSQRGAYQPASYRRGFGVATAHGGISFLQGREDVNQSIEYTRCSNATAFVVPFLGHNFGVGEETGSILERLSETHGDRLLFIHEDDVTSTMIRSASVRWSLRVETYETEAELVAQLRRFAGGVMQRERRGNLDRLD